MPQDSTTGGRGARNGAIRADEIGALIGAKRIGPKSNEFQWGERRVVIKSGPSAVVTEATLSRVDAVVFGEREDDRWVVYEINPRAYKEASVTSKSRDHDDGYRQVTRARLRHLGRQIHPASNWLDQVTGMFKDEPAFSQVIAYGKQARDADRPNGEDEA